MKMLNIIAKVSNFLFPKGTRWTIIVSLILGIIGWIVSRIISQPISILLQGVVTLFITAIIAAFAKSVLARIEEKYKGIVGKPTDLFEIFQLNDGANFYNLAHNIFFNVLIESYITNSKNRKYYIPIDTYYRIVMDFIKIGGYKLKTINGLLLPFWYAPREKNDILKNYIVFCKGNKESYKRVTSYEDDDWRYNTVKMIFEDIKSSEKSDDVAVRWLINLILQVPELEKEFGNNIKETLSGIELNKDIDYLIHDDKQDNEIIKKNIKGIEDFLNKIENGNATSRKMTAIIEEQFKNDMRENIFKKKSNIDSIFKDVINFEVVTEVGYYYKEENGKERDRFVMYQNGNNAGPSFEIEIITEEGVIDNIKDRLSSLFNENISSHE